MNIEQIFLDNTYKKSYYEFDYKEIETKFLSIKNLFNNSTELSTNNFFNNFSSIVKNDLQVIDYELAKSLDNLKSVIVSSRESTGYIYSSNLPLNKSYISENTTAVVEKETVFGKPDLNDLQLITSLTRSRFSFINSNNCKITTNDLLENFTLTSDNSIVIFEVNLEGISDLDKALIISFNQHQIIEVLSNGELLNFKSLKKDIILTINPSIKNITIRLFNPNKNKIKIDKIGISSLIYHKEVNYESVILPINKNFSVMSIDTCDNTFTNKVEINYEININNLGYEAFNPKLNNILDLQNTIVTEKNIQLEEKIGTVVNEDDVRFYLPDISKQTDYADVYLPNYKQIINTEFYLIVKEDMLLKKSMLTLNPTDKVYIDHIEKNQEDIKLYKGIRTLIIINSSNELTPINYVYLKNIFEVIYNKKIKKQIQEDSTNNFYISLTNADLKYNYTLSNSTEYKIHVKNKDRNINIESIQIRAKLKSLDFKTVPYISRILIRGL